MLTDMKTFALYVTVVTSCCLTATAQNATPAQQAPATKTTRTMSPESRAKMLAKTGGIVQSKAEGPSILFLNTQSRIVSDALSAVTARMVVDFMGLNIVLKDKPSAAPLTEALAALADTNVAAVVVIGDSDGYPALLIAPESRWALVNVAALGGNAVSTELLAKRTQKELWRAFGYLMGAAHSNLEHCLLKPVLTLEDLDALTTNGLSPESFNKIMGLAQKMGMKPSRRTTYRKAVEEGWAPAPTNDFQKAIWEELKR